MIQAPLVLRLRGGLDQFQPSIRRVAEYVLEDPRRAARSTITDLSAASGVSQTTVMRLCHELGLAGYREFRLAIAAETGRSDAVAERELRTGDIAEGDDLASVIAKIAYADARAVEDTARSLSVPELEAVVEAIATAGRVDIYGVGASGTVATDLQQKLHRIGRVAFAHADSHLALTSAALLGERDVAIGISHTGTTIDTVEALRLAGARGATTVALTNAPESPIARLADRVLLTAARETTFRSGATASRLAQLTVVDCVFVAIAQRTYDASQAALEVTRAAVEDRRYTRTRSGPSGI
ncbi:MurR/RpiR family transcriptional regulator [Occultella aeris]|uniref:Putative HTH-type transcriptional regulator YbbH n=1 Tax=Occultella aeris TaxID=2761496 RepID=A0A7M4DMG7_9MICO|nr:MurR/RpiR family transcriptional regulator [Occultella aeris]VZO38577.1 putative HTH-type transcriptional regulator YbbH [Occultella aeris]